MSSTTGFTNTCGIFTVLPMGLTCVTEDATTFKGTDGIMTLYITGGTPPYTIQWSTGSNNVTQLTGLTSGTYTASVVDFYGDYSATTSCVIGQPSPPPTPSATPAPSPTPLPIFPSNLCLTLTSEPFTQFGFDFQGIINGYPSWSGSNGNVIYDANVPIPSWVISGGSFNNIKRFTTSTIPTGTWVELGTNNTWNMITGTCTTQSLTMLVTTTNETCAGTSNGTVSVTAFGGVPPYTYSLDNVTFISASGFFNLPSGNGTVYVQDSIGTTISQNYNITAGSLPTTYTVSLSASTTPLINLPNIKSNSVSWTATVTPPLPFGVSINADILIQNQFTNYYYLTQNAIFNSNSTVTPNGSAVVNSTTDNVITNSGLRNCGQDSVPGFEFSGFTKIHNITLSGGSVSGVDTFSVGNDMSETLDCPVYGYNTYSVGVSNVTLNGTSCGSVVGLGGITKFITTSPFPTGL